MSVRAPVGALNVADHAYGIGRGLAAIRPHRATDPRYLWWALHAAVDGLHAIATGSTYPAITAQEVGGLAIATHPAERQRAIADYLDREMARIDALIENKQRLVELYQSRSWRYLLTLIDDNRAPLLPIRRVLEFITDGPFGSAFSSNDYSEEGAAVVRLGNIGFGEYRYEDQAYIPMSLYQEFPRCHVATGDVLIAGLGDANNHAGRACVAPDLGPAMVKGKCFCARVDRSRAIPEYVSWLLSSPLGAELVGAFGQGSTRTMINLEVIKALDVPMPSLGAQLAIVEAFGVERARSRTAAEFARRQVALLSEKRQAVITAAVNGHIPIPGAA
jgi:type I restriction enzyme S subunit